MTGFGVFMMLISNVMVIGLTVYCFYRVLAVPKLTQHEHAALEIDTRDDDPAQ